jgi:hypothetical protein
MTNYYSPGHSVGREREDYFGEVRRRWDAFKRETEALVTASPDPEAAEHLLATIHARPLEERLQLFREALHEAGLLGPGGIKTLAAALRREVARRGRVGRAKRHQNLV